MVAKGCNENLNVLQPALATWRRGGSGAADNRAAAGLKKESTSGKGGFQRRISKEDSKEPLASVRLVQDARLGRRLGIMQQGSSPYHAIRPPICTRSGAVHGENGAVSATLAPKFPRNPPLTVRMGCAGRYLAMSRAVRPVTVNTMIRAARSLVAARTAAVARASVCRC